MSENFEQDLTKATELEVDANVVNEAPAAEVTEPAAEEKVEVKETVEEPTKEEIAKVVSKVRTLDRAAQGISQEQESIAEEAIAKKEVLNENSYLVRMSHSKTSTVCDRLFGTYKNLLIISEDGEVNFFGSGKVINKIKDLVPGSWCGGDIANDNGFWGGYPSDQESIVDIVKATL